jgi:membrane-associated HD superfamily phosphohydrolase
VNPEPFTYQGPRPQSKETAIAMLADSAEAMVRASRDRSPEAIDRLVEQVMAERLSEGELDDADLTMRDLQSIGEAFKRMLRGVYHPRIEYPAPTSAERRALRESAWGDGVEVGEGEEAPSTERPE